MQVQIYLVTVGAGAAAFGAAGAANESGVDGAGGLTMPGGFGSPIGAHGRTPGISSPSALGTGCSRQCRHPFPIECILMAWNTGAQRKKTRKLTSQSFLFTVITPACDKANKRRYAHKITNNRVFRSDIPEPSHITQQSKAAPHTKTRTLISGVQHP